MFAFHLNIHIIISIHNYFQKDVRIFTGNIFLWNFERRCADSRPLPHDIGCHSSSPTKIAIKYIWVNQCPAHHEHLHLQNSFKGKIFHSQEMFICTLLFNCSKVCIGITHKLIRRQITKAHSSSLIDILLGLSIAQSHALL